MHFDFQIRISVINFDLFFFPQNNLFAPFYRYEFVIFCLPYLSTLSGQHICSKVCTFLYYGQLLFSSRIFISKQLYSADNYYAVRKNAFIYLPINRDELRRVRNDVFSIH